HGGVTLPYDMPVDFLERSHARQQKPRLNLNQLRQQVDLARQPLPGFSGAGLFFDTPESVQGVRIPGAARSANPTIQRALHAPTPEDLAKVALEQRQAAQYFRQQAGIPEGAPIGV